VNFAQRFGSWSAGTEFYYIIEERSELWKEGAVGNYRALAEAIQEADNLIRRTVSRAAHSRQKFLNRIGESSVYRTMCWISRWPR
jgi:hypothetical protein